MELTFEIMHVFHLHNRGQFILARLLDDGLDFELKDSAELGGIPIYNYIDMPRLLDDNNEQRLDVFIFRPLKPMQEGSFAQGQRVELILPNK
ncbi:hypothetical protein [Mucilaginibacter sp. FT3.2]|uniref:hypothetical protein n=1 Tax=Mucilaginibacter sp. FT3.2 TaxID=2723090 RepID=UPI00161FEE1E|nr:hypothetical protein [Mucilaginibacter sp. FT3.2]MBB6234849.1 hypothetical protein [Mucilaginibacter sp. FT3.2]